MSVIATKPTAINAAFLQEIKEDHVELRQLFSKLRRACAQSQHRRPSEMVYLMLALRDQLVTHFSLEESFGYQETTSDAAPRFADLANQLQAEHGSLLARFSQITHRGEALLSENSDTASFNEIVQELGDFCLDFADHERREVELLMSAYGDDVGGES